MTDVELLGATPPAPSEPVDGGGTSTLAAYAAGHGLTRSGARPRLLAYTRQLWQRRQFILAYARARNAAAYSESALGQLWQVITPLLNAAVYFFVFGLLLKTRAGVDNFIAFLVTGVFIFNYTQRATIGGANSVTSRLGLVRALHFPRATLPLATVVMELQQLLFALLVLLAIVLGTGEPVTTSWLLIVPALALQTLFNAGVAFACARLTTRLRDLQQLLPFLLRTLQYASGVFYSIAKFGKNAPEPVRLFLEGNPVAVYIELVRGALLHGYPVPTYAWPLAVLWAVVVFGLGYVYFWKAEEKYGRG
ncbi:MAG: ABC transporter permease [Pseudorhodobacter sp.]|nr:ABC transporter permease [Frankiaceae bacterium]